MKNKSIFIAIVLCVGLQSNMSFSAQQPQGQSYFQRLRSAVSNWWYNRGGSTSVKTGAMVGAAVPAAVLAVGAASPETLGVQDLSLSMDQETLLRGAAATVTFAGIGAVSAVALNAISQAWQRYVAGTMSEGDAKLIIKNVIEKSFLSKCPTKATKLDLLNKKRNYFSAKLSKKGISTQEQQSYKNLIDKICDELILQINQTPETGKDQSIDNRIGILKSGLKGSTLDKLKQLNSDNLQAHLYMLFDLENQLIQEE